METKLKPFDLAAALEGKKVITRNGKVLEDLYYFKSATREYPFYAQIEGIVCSFSLKGKYRSEESDYDLFMAPETVTKWVNVYDRRVCYEVGCYKLYDSEESAKTDAWDKNCITVPITFEI